MKCPQNETMRKTGKFLAETNVESPKWLSEEVNIINICETTIASFSSQAFPSITSGNNIVSILLTDDEKMSGLNKLYRNKVGPTAKPGHRQPRHHQRPEHAIERGDAHFLAEQ